MSRPLSFGSAVSTFVLTAMLASCAAPQQKTGFGGKADENVGLATRAVLALNAHDLTAAVDFAERAVEKNPDDAGFRAILGNAYFAAGRFWSAEAAYKDSLTIYSNQPQVILKLSLVETALGKKDSAVAFLEAGKSVLNPSDYGLALALAGRPADAITVLETAARKPGSDSTVRQNLALAHALAGDWTEARTIAAQDVPAGQLDARIQQWMQLASPKKPADQVAALVGVTPVAIDHGEPVRLALRSSETMLASAAPATGKTPAPVIQAAPARVVRAVPAPAIKAAPAVAMQMAKSAPQPVPATTPKLVEAVAAPSRTPQPALAIAPVMSAPRPAPNAPIAEAPAPSPVQIMTAAAHEVSARARALVEAFMPRKAPVVREMKTRHVIAARHVLHRGDPVVQLGAYRSPQYVSAAWNKLTQHYPALRAYLPLRARFDSPKGTFWRLSIQGFGNEREAVARCKVLKSHGGNCFVRNFAGDAPVEIASN